MKVCFVFTCVFLLHKYFLDIIQFDVFLVGVIVHNMGSSQFRKDLVNLCASAIDFLQGSCVILKIISLPSIYFATFCTYGTAHSKHVALCSMHVLWCYFSFCSCNHCVFFEHLPACVLLKNEVSSTKYHRGSSIKLQHMISSLSFLLRK